MLNQVQHDVVYIKTSLTGEAVLTSSSEAL